MTDEEYLKTQTQLFLVAAILKQMDLVRFLDRARTAEAVGPVLDPTLYQIGGRRLHDIIELASAAAEFKSRIEQLEGRQSPRTTGAITS